MSLLALISMRKPTRKTAWSSTSMMRSFSITSGLPGSVQRQRRIDAHAAAGSVTDADLAAEHARAFAHAAHAEVARPLPVRRQAGTIVADFQDQHTTALAARRDVDPPRPAVAQCIRRG